MPHFLTAQSMVLCPHGGTATLSTANAKVKADQGFILLESDQHTVAACPYIDPSSQSPSPCITIQWSGGTQKFKVNSQAALTESSTGQCSSAAQLIQGTAVIANTQSKGSGQ